MVLSRPTKPDKRSIVMIEWSRYVTPTHQKRDEFLWHQIVMSLLYDEVLAQDQTILCSKDMADWFGNRSDFGLLEELFECGGLVMLKRPSARYPAELRDKLSTHPIAARIEQLEKFSAHNDGSEVIFSPAQRQFHNLLENFIREPRRNYAHREAGVLTNRSNLMGDFSQLLQEVLTDKRYEKWLKSEFQRITPAIAQDFVRFAEEPERAIARVYSHRQTSPRVTPLSDKPQFSTALAVQVASTYPNDAATALQSLVETVFARPFCQEENADGRYGRLLRSLPTDIELENAGESISLVHIEPSVLRLPTLRPGYSKIINAVREGKSGRNLRMAMGLFGADPIFSSVTKAWNDVADDLASLMNSSETRTIELHTVALRYGKSMLVGVAVGDLVARAFHGPHMAFPGLEATIGGLAVPLFEAALDHLWNTTKIGLRRQRDAEAFKSAVAFSCIPSSK